MDKHNRFVGRGAYALLRLEALVGLAAAVALAIAHRSEIRWGPFALLFLWIDLAGYVPGAIAHRRGPVSRLFYVLYNLTHSFVLNAALAGLWALAIGPEWALLAPAIHLLGDRALFGNFPKSFAAPFEPEPLPAFVAFERGLGGTP